MSTGDYPPTDIYGRPVWPLHQDYGIPNVVPNWQVYPPPIYDQPIWQVYPDGFAPMKPIQPWQCPGCRHCNRRCEEPLVSVEFDNGSKIGGFTKPEYPKRGSNYTLIFTIDINDEGDDEDDESDYDETQEPYYKESLDKSKPRAKYSS